MAKEKVEADTSGAIAGLVQLGSSVNNLIGLAKAAAIAFASIKIVQATFQSMTTAENQIIRLKTALQSATKGVQDYEQAIKFAAKTPFNVESVINASVALRTFQFNPFEKVDKGGRQLMEVLGDMAGAMGHDVEDAAHALTRALVGEWEVMQNNYQISARMIPKLAGLTSGSKEYRDEIVKFIAAQDRFRGGMDLTAKSLRGMMSNMTDAIDLVLMGIGGVADAEGKLRGLTLFDSVKKAFQGIYASVTNNAPLEDFNRVMTLLNTKGLKPELLAKTQKELEAFGPEKAARLKGYNDAVAKAFGNKNISEADKLNFLIQKQGANISDLVSQGEKLTLWGRMLGQVFKLVFDITIAPLFDKIGQGINYMLDQGQKIMEWVVPIQGIGNTTAQLFEGVSKKVTNLIQKSGSDSVSLLKQFQAMASEYIQSTSEKDKNALEERFLKSKNVLEKQFIAFAIIMKLIGVIIKTKVDEIWGWFDGMGSSIGATFSSLWDGIGLGFGALWEPIKDGFDLLVVEFKGLIKELKMAFSSLSEEGDTLQEIGYVIGVVIGTAVRIVIGLVRSLVATFSILIKSLSVMVKGALNMFSGLANVFRGFLNIFKGNFLEGFSEIGTGLKKILLGALDFVTGAIMAALTPLFGVINAAGSLFGKPNLIATSQVKNAQRNDFQQQNRDDLDKAVKEGKITHRERNAKIENEPQMYGDEKKDEWLKVEREKKERELALAKLKEKEDKKNTERLNDSLQKIVANTKPPEANTANLPREAIGEWNVPRNMSAYIHKGEMVIPAREAANLRSLFLGTSGIASADTHAQLTGRLGMLSDNDFASRLGTNNTKPMTVASPIKVDVVQNFYGQGGIRVAGEMKTMVSEVAQKYELLKRRT